MKIQEQDKKNETYDLAASLATMSDNEIDSCRGLFLAVELLDRPGKLLLPSSCEDGGGGGMKLKGLLLS